VGPQPAVERDKAIGDGITVNGLAITNSDPTLDTYFGQVVIGGPGAFVLEAEDYADIAVTIRKKLLRELASNLSSVPVTPDRQIAGRASSDLSTTRKAKLQ
jgi:hypothetical protein